MKKSLLAVALVLTMVFCLFPVTARAASDVPEGYIPVSTPEDLNAIRFDMNGKYFLTNDIDLTEALSKGGSLYLANGWATIGETEPFTGVIDGNGHTISGYFSNTSLINVNEGILRNLSISGRIHSVGTAGGFVCVNKGVLVNCENQIQIDVQDAGTAGGLAGNNYGIVLACSNYGYILSYKQGSIIGGIVGVGYDGSLISNCYNSGRVGVGRMGGNTPVRYNYAGGILGYSALGNVVTIVNCYNAGEIQSVQDNSITGFLSNDAITVIQCYYNAFGGTASGVALSEASMKDSRAFAGFDFDRVWTMGTGDYKYPVLTGACPHVLNHTEATEPSCEVDGNREFWYCSVCEKYFSDAEAKTEMQPYEIPVSGAHSFVNYISDGNATCTADGTKTAKCENCDAVDTVIDAGSKTAHDYENGSCTECGEEGGFHRADFDCDGDVDVDDVLTLLWYVLFPDDYPID